MLAERKRITGKPKKSRRSRGRPRLEDVADIERELLDIALSEFLKNGYGGTSMANIVRAAGISKTTLYSRFTSKEDLFLTIMEKMFGANRVTEIMTGDSEPPGLEEGLRAYIRRALEVGSHELVMGISRLIYAEAHRFPSLAVKGRELYNNVDRAIARFIADCAVREGVPCKDPSKPAFLLSQMMRGFYADQMLAEKPATEAEMAKWADDAVDVLLTARADW